MTDEPAGDDRTLITETLAGNPRAFGGLVRRWYRPVLAICIARLGRLADAEDAAQETFLRGYRSLTNLRSSDQLGPWLRGIAHHVCVDQIRDCQRHRQIPVTMEHSEVIATAAPGPIDNLVAAEDREMLLANIARLPDTLREVLLLHYFDKRTYEAIAELLGIARATVSERLRKARHQLRQFEHENSRR